MDGWIGTWIDRQYMCEWVGGWMGMWLVWMGESMFGCVGGYRNEWLGFWWVGG